MFAFAGFAVARAASVVSVRGRRPLAAIIAAVMLAACGDAPTRLPTPRPRECAAMSVGCACGTAVAGDGRPCDTESVLKEVGQQGVCCQSEAVCQCRLRECAYVADSNSCVCGSPQNLPGAVRVSDCGMAMAGLTCCLNSFLCICGTTPCGDPSENVPNCTLADVTKCDVPAVGVASCTSPGATMAL